MRKHADWLTQVDERILEFLAESGNHPPSAIADRFDEIGVDLEYHPKYIGQECRKLTNHGLLRNGGAGTYSITKQGRDFLAGELDAGALNDEE